MEKLYLNYTKILVKKTRPKLTTLEIELFEKQIGYTISHLGKTFDFSLGFVRNLFSFFDDLKDINKDYHQHHKDKKLQYHHDGSNNLKVVHIIIVLPF